ncbi:cyclase family protein [Actinocorallia sp. A-T 12471]|uniref:cyclase family protein n=1 Tax=Actinocorallia sp. A-T 12471 TaxID=3089813 RepID=UPI0029D030CB|nr:cyclase family protein [Actinocorallia sp. A-T 12471]MDX6738158.1 cyclase family protein [Actinocorallia sp. A-T 12471]
MGVVAGLLGALDGSVRVVDLTSPLHEGTPILQLPEPFANTIPFSRTEISRYDARGPAWYWNDFACGEHTGTHFDAPVHWITGKDGEDVSQVPARRLFGQACVIDVTAKVEEYPGYLLTVSDIHEWEAEHGALPDNTWLLLRTGWSVYGDDAAKFLNPTDNGPITPGVTVECAQWLADDPRIIGLGVETVGTDAGAAHSFDPAFPCHQYLLGANKYGLTQLRNLAELPPRGALLIAAPLPIVGGSGSPARVLALVDA